MKNKILLGLAGLAVVGLAGFAATQAFFTAQGSSTGNVFTAGTFGNIQVAVANRTGDTNNASHDYVNIANGRATFNFSNLIPGDSSTGDVLIKSPSQNAWMCMKADNLDDMGNATKKAAAQNIELGYWVDTDNSGTANTASEQATFHPDSLYNEAGSNYFPIVDAVTNNTGAYANGIGNTQYNQGYAVCFGNFTGFDANGVPTCDGSSVGNDAQGGVVKGNLEFYAEQAKNNGSFTCADLNNSTTVVDATNMNGWYFYNDVDDSTPPADADHGFVTGPDSTPLGTGSVHLTKSSSPITKYGIGTAQFVGTAMSDITKLQYSTYQTSADAPTTQAPSLSIDIDSNTTDSDTGYQGRLTYEPYFSGNTVQTGVWQTWNALDNSGNGNWWFSHTSLSNGEANQCPQSNPCTWSELMTDYPNLGISGNFLIRTNGADNQAFDGNADNLEIGTADGVKTYDFGN